MNKEIIRLLDMSLSAERTHPMEHRRALATAQADAWSRLGGRWISGAGLMTGNRKHYERIENLRIEDWIRG